jgi:class 3 adenylate cyclase
MSDQFGSSIHPLKAIARKFEFVDNREIQDIEHGTEPPVDADPASTPSSCPVLSPQYIQAPAILIDNALTIVWQNTAAKVQLWHLTDDAIDTLPADLHLFDLLFNLRFQQSVENWKQWVIYFVTQAHCAIALDDLERMAGERLEDDQRNVFLSLLAELPATPPAVPLKNCLPQIYHDGSMVEYWVVGTNFDQGRLLVFERALETQRSSAVVADLDQRVRMLRNHPQPVKVSFFVLAAKLNNDDTLRTEMLDEEYSCLLQRLWRIAIETIEEYRGIVGHYNGHRLTTFFLPVEAESDNSPLSVIQCAMALKARMNELGREWKIRKGWLHDIDLNIGLSAGSEHVLMIQSALGENLMPLGETMQVAGYLSSIAVNGQIWATKNLINQVSRHDLKSIRFGIFRKDNNRQIFISNCFSRIRDLTFGKYAPAEADIGAQAVTQIYDRSTQGG